MAHDSLGIQYDISIYFMVAKTTDHGDIMRICITYGGFHKCGYPQCSSILMGFSLVNHPVLGTSMENPKYLF